MVRGLRPVLEGSRLAAVRVLDARLLSGCSADSLAAAVAGAVVEQVCRRGKWVVLILSAGAGLIVIQPRMTGGFWLTPPPRPDHVRLIFELRGRRHPIWFCDTRRLGRVTWFPDPSAAERAFARSHGPDALQIGLDDLAARLARTTRAIKPALMDQKVLAGIGNIYADEILFEAQIHPSRPAATLRPTQIAAIHRAISAVLWRAIAAEGSSFDAGYRTVLGLEGGFLASNNLYGREGQPCRRCGLAIRKTRIPGLIGRPTYVCTRCQRPPRSVSGRSGRIGGVALD